jgi:replication factor A1
MSLPAPALDSGVLARIFDHENPPNPVVQIIQIRPFQRADGPTRIRVAISDGVHFSPAFISQVLKKPFEDQLIKLFDIVRVSQYLLNETYDRTVLILVDMEVVNSRQHAVLGSPAALPQNGGLSQSPAVSQRAPIEPPGPKKSPRPIAGSRVMTIAHLNPYIPRPTIVAKVLSVSSVTPYKGRIREDGKLFRVILKDLSQCEIRGTFFDEQVDRFFPLISVNKVYEFSGGSLRSIKSPVGPNRQDCEFTFDATTQITEVDDPEVASVSMAYAFTPLGQVPNVVVNREIDILVWAYAAEAVTDVNIKKGTAVTQRRRIQVCDESEHRGELTFWGGEAVAFPEGAGCVLSVKDARVSSFNGRSLSASASSTVSIDPEIPEAAALREWAQSGIDFASLPNISAGSNFTTPYAYLAQINEQQLGTHEKPDYITAYVMCADVPVGHRMYYQACPNPACKFKGFSNRIPGDNSFVCDRCHQTIARPKLRYNFSVKLADFSGSVQAGVLGDDALGAQFTGVGVDEWVCETNDGQDEHIASSAVRKHYFQPLQVKCRVKTDVYNEISRVKVSLINATKVAFAEGARFYAAEIAKFTLDG